MNFPLGMYHLCWLKQNDGGWVTLKLQYIPACETPASLNGVEWHLLSQLDLNCHGKIWFSARGIVLIKSNASLNYPDIFVAYILQNV